MISIEQMKVSVSAAKKAALDGNCSAEERTAAGTCATIFSCAIAISERLDLSDVGVRQHLNSLERIHLVASRPLPAEGRGRPGVTWRLTELGHRSFPERHADLAVNLITACSAEGCLALN